MLMAKDMTEDEFNELYPDSFFVSDFGFGRLHELCERGATIKLNRENVQLYIDSFVQKFFEQDRIQFAALFRGVETVCGKFLLKMLTEEMAEARGCSSKQVSWQAMKRQLVFSCERRSKENFLWCIKEMTNTERQKLLKFFTGATRLIPNQQYDINDQYVDD